MKQKTRKLRLFVLSLLALIVCATVSAFIGINFGDKFISASAFVKKDPDGNYILDKEEHFNITTSSDGKTVTFSGLSSEGYRVLGCSIQDPALITQPFVVHIPEGVTRAAGSFLGCSALKGITMPEGLTQIDTSLALTDVRSLSFPKTIKSIGTEAKTAPYLESVTVEEYTEEEIAAGATQTFYSVNDQYVVQGAKAATSGKSLVLGAGGDVTVTDDISSLLNYAFRYRNNLKSVYLPASVTSIGQLALSATTLETITIDPANNTYSDGSNLDANGNKVSSGAIAGGNCIISKYNNKFVELYLASSNRVIPACVTRFGEAAFKGVYGASSIVIPAQVTYISAGGLAASDVENITVEEGNPAFFSKVDGVETNCVMQYANSKQVDGKTHYIMFAGSVNSRIPNCVYKIATCAFEHNEALTSMTVPDSVTEIGDYCFYESHLSDLHLSKNITTWGRAPFGNTPYYASEDRWENGKVFYIDCYLMQASTNISGHYSVKDGTVAIIGDAFVSCEKLTSVTIPDSVKHINNGAFNKDTNLTTVYVPATLETVGTNVFPSQVRLIAENKDAYDTLANGALSKYKSQLGYAVDATFKVANETINTKKLAGQTFGYKFNEETQEWKNLGFSPNGFYVELWKNDADGTVSAIGNDTPIPANVSSLSFTAMEDNDNELEKITMLGKIKLEDMSLEYGSDFDYPLGFNASYMDIRFVGEDIFGAKYDGVEPPKNVGTYTVSITPAATYSWNDGTYAAVTATLKITPKVIEEIKWNNLEHLYDGKSPFVWAEFEGYQETVMLSAKVTATDAGKYEVTVELPEVCNYRLAAYANSVETLVINPRVAEVEWTGMNGFKWVYDGDPHNPVMTLSTNLNNANIKYEIVIKDSKGNIVTGGAIDSGKYTMTITLKNDGTNGNFIFEGEDDEFTAHCDFEILEKVTIQIIWENVADVTYDGNAHNPKAYYTIGNSGEKHYLDVTLKYGDALEEVLNAINAGSYTASITLPDEYADLEADAIGGDTEVTFEIFKLEITIDWLNYYPTIAYDGYAHNPVAYYVATGKGWMVKLDVEIKNSASEAVSAIEVGSYTASIISDLSNFIYSGDIEKTFEIEKQLTQITEIIWTGTTTFIFNGEAQSPLAELFNLDGEAINASGTTEYGYATADGTMLSGAPVKVGKYKVTATFKDRDGDKIATAAYTYEIVKAKVVKPVVALSVFASVDEAKAYAPLGYDANTMVISGAEGDGLYVMTVALKNSENYEWMDGETEDIDFTLKISPVLTSTVVGPDGIKYISNSIGNKTVFYALAGTVAAVALVSLIALILALKKRRGVADDGGFYDDYED